MLSFAYKRFDGKVPEPGELYAEDQAPGQALRQPAPLFKKLDERLIDEEYARLGK